MLADVSAIVHTLAGAAWFGAMFYSLMVLQPKAKAYFENDPKFEDFIATISRGARWKVLSAFAIVLLSGVALILLARPEPMSVWWLTLIALKTAAFVIALAIFCYASWRLWPARIFATTEEIPAIQQRFRRIGITLLILVGLAMALGVVAHAR